ncbi:MAG TPA: Gfo/Idh/MocA family oxidoreductase [Thermodesulfobacteriota bacterium]|nr:Gfo/Idh/MocA family oxidoreductase [Thermodesulfobacteriota bacterium]
MDKVRLGMIGSQFAASLHLNSLSKLRGSKVEVVAVASKNKEHAESFAKSYHIPDAYEDYRRILERRDVHVVDLCLTTDLHHTTAVDAANAGKHIICEKPLTGYFGEPKKVSFRSMMDEASKNASAVQKAVQTNKVKFGYAENFVYAPPVTKLKSLMKACQGTVLDIRAEESHSGSHAPYSREWKTSGGGSLMRLGSHPIGAVLHLKHYEGMMKFGRPIRAQSIIGDIGHLTKMEAFQKEPKKWMVDSWIDVEDWSAALITFDDGSKATLHATDVSLGGVKNLISVYLSNAVAYANINPNTSIVVYSPEANVFGSEYISEKVETKAGWQFPSPDEDWMRGYPQELEDFIDAILLDREPISGIDLAREVVDVIYAVYVSAEKGSRIELQRS